MNDKLNTQYKTWEYIGDEVSFQLGNWISSKDEWKHIKESLFFEGRKAMIKFSRNLLYEYRFDNFIKADYEDNYLSERSVNRYAELNGTKIWIEKMAKEASVKENKICAENGWRSELRRLRKPPMLKEGLSKCYKGGQRNLEKNAGVKFL